MEISTKTGKNGKIHVHADGEYRFTVPAFIWYGSGLYEGAEADEETLAALEETGEREQAYERALRLLSMRAHSETELRRKLRERCSAAAAADAVARCRGAGLINDAVFAETYARELYERKFYAPARILQALYERGVDKKTAEAAIETLAIDDSSAIINIINKMHLPETLTRKDLDRLLRRLQSAGYTMGQIRQAVQFSYPEDEA